LALPWSLALEEYRPCDALRRQYRLEPCDLPRSGDFVGEPMSETLGRLPSVAFWIAITLLLAVVVICLLGSAVGLEAET
jgi:hypothetical protein